MAGISCQSQRVSHSELSTGSRIKYLLDMGSDLSSREAHLPCTIIPRLRAHQGRRRFVGARQMPATIKQLRHDMIRKTLAPRAGSDADARAIAVATISIWQQISVRLVRLIGVRGVDALFCRSLHLAGRSFPFLIDGGNHRDRVALLAHFRACIETREKLFAAEVCFVLLATFTDLLATLIGES